MTPVTDPNLIAQLEGNAPSGGMTPVTDPALISQLEGNSNSPLLNAAHGQLGSNPAASLPRYATDALAGFAQFGHGLINTPHNLISSKIPAYLPGYDYGKALGVNNPDTADQLVQGAAQYAPYMLGAAPEILSQMGAGAAYGLTQSPTPLKSAPVDAALNGLLGLGGKALGYLAGTKNAQNALGNTILKQLGKSSATGAALTPQDAAENLAQNYSGAQGQPLNVDIGTLTNNPALKGIYNSLKYVPSSGVSKNINMLNRQLSTKGIADTQNNLNDAYVNNALGQTNARTATRAESGDLFNQLQGLAQQQQPYTEAINNAPSFLNNLAAPLGKPTDITKNLKNSVADAFNANRKTSNLNYGPINNSNLRLDTLGINNLFPNYGSAAKELLANRENLNNLFDQDSDLSSKLRNELDKAQGLLSNNKNFGVTMPEVVKRIQNLGQLGASANSQGRRYEGMLLNNMRDGLSTDLGNTLRSSGNEGLANQLEYATQYHKNNVIPFYQNNEIRKAVTSQSYIPAQAKLAKALHDPNSQSILTQLPPEAKNAALYQLLTGGKGTSSGLSNMGADAIGNAYTKLPVDTKTAIAQYNPQADQYFEQLPDYLARNQEIETAKAPLSKQLGKLPISLSKQLEKLGGQGQKSIQSLQSQLSKLKEDRYGTTPEKGAGVQKLAKIAEGAGALAIGHLISPYAAAALPISSLLARTTAKTLSNPELIQAYINGGRLPVANTLGGSLAKTLPPAIVTPGANSQVGGQ